MKADEREKKFPKWKTKRSTRYRLRAESWKQIAWKQGLGWWTQGPRKALSECQDEGSGETKRWRSMISPLALQSTQHPFPAQQRTGAHHVRVNSHAGERASHRLLTRTTRNRDEHGWAASQLVTDLAIEHELKAERHYVFEGKKCLSHINLFQDTRGI